MPKFDHSVFIAPGAVVLGDVEIGAEASIWYNCVVRGDVESIRIGPRTNVQDLTVIHVTSHRASTRIGADCTIGHRAIIHGCDIGDRCLIGMGAIVMDGVVVGEGSIIGAGAVVAPGTHIPPGVLALGMPAKVVRPLRQAEIADLTASAARYASLAAEHRAAAAGAM